MHESWHVRRGHADESNGMAIGSVSLGFSKSPRFARDVRSGMCVALDGELYESSVEADRLQRAGIDVGRDDHAMILLAGYRREGAAFLRRLHGSFSAVVWDSGEQTLALITDRFATRPLYYRQAKQGLRFASGIAALLAGDESPCRVNPRGLAQFFTFGHYLRDDTSLEDVRVLPAAACFVFRRLSGELGAATYWSLRERAEPAGGDRQELLAEIDDRFMTAVRRCSDETGALGLSLSGGLDARTILGVLDVRQTPVQTVCLGMLGSLDHRASAALARIAGCRFHPHVLDALFLRDFRNHLQRMVQLTDGQYLSQCIVIPTFSVYRKLGIQALLRGHAGELMHMTKAYSYSLDAAALEIRTDSQLRAWLFRRLQAYMLDGVREPLFAKHYQNGLVSLAQESLNADLADVAHVDQPLQRIWHLFVTQRMRREMVLSLQKFRSTVEPRLPYLDNDLVPLLLALPPHLKLGEEIQTYILNRRRPEFLKVINANTGACMGASPWRQRVATFQMKVLAKLGVPGYQPYERLGRWLRRELAPMVRDVLFDTQTLDRGIYRPEGIRAVVRQHLDQGHNHTFLLMALMIFELGLRRQSDTKPVSPPHDSSAHSAALALSAATGEPG